MGQAISKKFNLILLIQSLMIGYFIFIIIHPSMPIARIIGFFASSAVFYISWLLFPLITKRKDDCNKFSLLFVLSLFFPHYLLRDYHFIALIFVVYYAVIYLYIRFSDLSAAMIILFLIISLSFSILYIAMNNEYRETRLEKSLARNIEGPVRYRILVPEAMNLSTLIFGLDDILGLMIIFRFASTALVFLSTYLLVKFFSGSRYLALFLPLLYVFMMSFSWDVLYVTDFPEILFVTLFIYNMFKGNYVWSGVFFILGSLNKDTIVFSLAFFGFYTLLKEKNPVKDFFKILKRSKKIFLVLLGLLILFLALKFTVVRIYGNTWYTEKQFNENIYSVKEYKLRFERFNFDSYGPGLNRFFTFLIFAGGIYVLLFLFFKKIPKEFSISFLLTFLLFMPFYWYIGLINETRILYVFYPYIIICLAYILKDDFSNNLKKSQPL